MKLPLEKKGRKEVGGIYTRERGIMITISYDIGIRERVCVCVNRDQKR
jgi:hypothetical protein